MIDPPLSRDEAMRTRYGASSLNPNGNKWDARRCAYEVSAGAWHFSQCSRAASVGPAQLYCKQHTAIINARIARQARK
jgi:hypothetical protein